MTPDPTPTERCALDVLIAARLLDDATLNQQVLVFHQLATERLERGEEKKADVLMAVAALLAAVQDDHRSDLARMEVDLELDGDAVGALVEEGSPDGRHGGG